MSSIYQYSQLVRYLREHGYNETTPLHQSADFSVLGDTVSWWPVTATTPHRLQFFGEDLEQIERWVDEVWEHLPLASAEIPPLIANAVPTEHGTIHPGEYIVHPNHGVGIFERIQTQKTLDGTRQFISLQYAGNDRILFPSDRQAELMPYIGSRHPRLTRLYSKSWQNTKERIERDLIGIARELLTIFATRHQATRPPINWEPEWEQIISDEAGFTLTEDQARCMTDIQEEMTGRRFPMDRLVCGDVGFGKTEIALRTAVQVIAAGRQVALIAPTTVLAEQHFALFKRRLANLPINVEHVSRLTKGREKEIAAKLQAGEIDILVGTHRVLGKDMHFKNIGLLILDEEQKFGVVQKEHLKELRPNIDVLSLSATPIPRTLSMSLSGLRTLSILRTPPRGRLPITTKVQEYSDAVLGQVLADELARGGQAYVVHNRVQSLQSVLERVRKLLITHGHPEARIELAHGQMDDTVLARTMSGFLGGEVDVLVASSIVEHGLDCPAANTLVVLHSEWFGLSDLYQLRGRVGRRQTQAHAYFMLGGIERAPYGEVAVDSLQVTETARKRLHALLEADELGSGWSVALRDLEIRGGGNILGHEQHGSMEAIGLLLYSQLLQEAIGRQAKIMGVPLFQTAES